MLNTTIGKLRVTGFLEGLSFLFLLFISMPLKYIWDIPEFVTYNGMIHGALFVLYVLVVGYVTYQVRWSKKWMIGALAASVIPFGNFVLDRKLQGRFPEHQTERAAG
ncbi:DUF3817 domain-containing protein [Halobacillus sp. ACCC02827]|uniref:DUF3817 domain-containing protein n=1 Tax=unclassified Halobacillus TaxID=2636472 RepID=UPI0007859850|nr:MULTISPECIES: DUF3817 domain-containing protein [unclassified Halobacillus]WJE15726.1 DUF3817 domain-containing protein [Halobacillus sp. ACCC02827]